MVAVFEAGHIGDLDKLLGMQEIHVTNGYSSGTEAIAHFGLGDIDMVDVMVELPWGAGTWSVLNVPASERYTLNGSAVIPEPGTFALLLFGVAAGVGGRSGRRSGRSAALRSTIPVSVLLLAATSSAPAANTNFDVTTYLDPAAAQQAFVDGRQTMRMKSEGELPLGTSMSASTVGWTPQNTVLWGDVTHMEASYKGEAGMIGGGSPFFAVLVDKNGNGQNDVTYDPNSQTWDMGGDGTVAGYWGSNGVPPQESFSGDWETTGNMIGDPAIRWSGAQVGIPGTVTHAGTLPYAGNMQVLWLSINLNTGWFNGNEPFDLVQMLLHEISFQGVRHADSGGGLAGTSFSETMAIPEPGTACLLFLGAGGILARRRQGPRPRGPSPMR